MQQTAIKARVNADHLWGSALSFVTWTCDRFRNQACLVLTVDHPFYPLDGCISWPYRVSVVQTPQGLREIYTLGEMMGILKRASPWGGWVAIAASMINFSFLAIARFRPKNIMKAIAMERHNLERRVMCQDTRQPTPIWRRNSFRCIFGSKHDCLALRVHSHSLRIEALWKMAGAVENQRSSIKLQPHSQFLWCSFPSTISSGWGHNISCPLLST